MWLNLLKDLRARSGTSFWQTELARRALSIELSLATDFIARLSGETVIWLGSVPEMSEHIKRRDIRSSIYLSPRAAKSTLPSVQVVPEKLPFQSRSIDAVVIHHSLEQVSDPRTVLREVVRILAPGGRLIVLGFNPWSLLGIRRGLASVLADPIRQLRFVNPIRLFDWLTLLGLELDAPPAYGGLSLFWNRIGRNLLIPPAPSQIPFSGLVVTSAVKQQSSGHFSWPAQPKVKESKLAYPRVAVLHPRPIRLVPPSSID